MLYSAVFLLALVSMASAQVPAQSPYVHYHQHNNPGAQNIRNPNQYPGQQNSNGFIHSHLIPCRTDSFQLPVNRTFVVADRSVVCTGSFYIHRCNGACWTTYYTDPYSLVAVKGCDYCQPTHQARQQANVIFYCNIAGFARTSRQAIIEFIQPTACACLSC